MKRFGLNIILIFALNLLGYSQFSYLDTTYKLNNYHWEYSYSSQKLSEGKFVLAGYAANDKYEINIFCINEIGDTIWNKEYNVDSVGMPWVSRLRIDSQKNLVLAGYIAVNHSQEVRALLMKTDSLGNLKWIHVYSQQIANYSQYTGLYGDALVATKNNQYLLVCQIGVDTGVANFLAINTDSNGIEIARWQYNSLYYELPKCAIQTSDSGFLFGGFSTRQSYSVLKYIPSIYLIKTDRNGVKQWDTTIASIFSDSLYTGEADAEDVVEVADGFVIAGERANRSNLTYPMDERGWSKCWIGKLDKQDGHLIWEHYYGIDTADFAHFYGITSTSDGGFALCGAYNYVNDTYNTGWIMKTDANGDSLWSYVINRHIDSAHYTEQMELHCVHEIEGGYMVTGFRIPNWPFDGNTFPYVFTVDSNGCPYYNCVATAIKEVSEKVDINLYPNPANTILYVLVNNDNATENLSLIVYDISGRAVLNQQRFNAGVPCQLNVSSFSAGMYFVQVTSGGNIVTQRKFIKE